MNRDLLRNIYKFQLKNWYNNFSLYRHSRPVAWKELIPHPITIEMVQEAWPIYFDRNTKYGRQTNYPPVLLNQCKVYKQKNTTDNVLGIEVSQPGYTITGPMGTVCSGGFVYYTDKPAVFNEDLYEMGCSWGIDLLGVRYHKVDKNTGMPLNWSKVKAQYIISIAIESLVTEE